MRKIIKILTLAVNWFTIARVNAIAAAVVFLLSQLGDTIAPKHMVILLGVTNAIAVFTKQITKSQEPETRIQLERNNNETNYPDDYTSL